MATEAAGRSGAVIRPGRPAERSGVQAVVRDAYREFEPLLAPEHWQRMTSNLAVVVDRAAEHQLLVAELDGKLAGTVTYLRPDHPDYEHVPQDWAVIRALAVAPAARGRGVGAALTRECLRRASADAAPVVGLHTAEMMIVARSMYERMGFGVQREFRHLGLRFLVYRLVL